MDNGSSYGSSYGMGGPVGGPVGGPPRSRYNRMQSDPAYNRYNNANGYNGYPTSGYQQPRDTVHTNGSNGSPNEHYASDPSSENSSIERAPPVRQPDMGEQYGFHGFGGDRIMEENSQDNAYFTQPPNQGNSAPPPVPAKVGSNQPARLTKNNSNSPPPVGGQARPSNEKRRSWFKRRFSKE